MEFRMNVIESAQSVDEFTPIRTLGHGDMGTVYLAKHMTSGKPVAMKVMSKELMQKKRSHKRAWMEKEILQKLDHPFLPKLFTKFESKNHSFLLMSYCSGGDLNTLRQRQKDRKFSESAARFYAAEVVLALEYLHQHGILYRDLKPENILLQADGHIMITDFDLSLMINNSQESRAKDSYRDQNGSCKKKTKSFLAKLNPGHVGAKDCMNASAMITTKQDDSAKETSFCHLDGRKESVYEQAHSFVGTEEYVAPEILWGKGHGIAVDWWAFGVLLYEMVYGKTPFKGCNRKETFYNILCKEPPQLSEHSSPLKDLLRRLLVKEPTLRLGFNSGAQEIKNHEFFEGVRWDELEYVSRPPFVPPPFSFEHSRIVMDDSVHTIEMFENF
uniref:non-specific serine/threonine protein kinase n=1 Tax=Picea sitchensis TaxID=3332 RepID=A9NPF9_PICSI|nr:unknown [Picea sitchensis]